MYAGIRGNTQGEMKLIKPAKKARVKETIIVVNYLINNLHEPST